MRSVLSRAAPLFGWDAFVSFALGAAPRGATEYARRLHEALEAKGFTVFFSEEAGLAGSHLSRSLKRHLRRSRVLIVLANRGTLDDPRWVRDEVLEFRQSRPGRTIIPISFDGALRDPACDQAAQPWLAHRERIWIDETDDALAQGRPSADVVAKVAGACTAIRSTVWLRGVLVALAAVFAGLAALAAVWAVLADRAESAARGEQDKAVAAERRAIGAASAAIRAEGEARRAASAAEDARMREERQRANAEARAREAQAHAVAEASAFELARGRGGRALLGAAIAWTVAPTPRAEAALLGALLARPRLMHEVPGAKNVGQLALVGGGKTLLSIDGRGDVEGFSVGSGEPLSAFRRAGLAAPGARLVASPDSLRVAVNGRDHWRLLTANGHDGPSLCAAPRAAKATFTADGRLFVAQCLAEPVDLPRRPEAPPRPDARSVLGFFDPESGREVAPRAAVPAGIVAIGAVQALPDEIIAVTSDGRVQGYRMREPVAWRTFKPAAGSPMGRVSHAAFAPEGSRLVLVEAEGVQRSEAARVSSVRLFAWRPAEPQPQLIEAAASRRELPDNEVPDSLAISAQGHEVLVGTRSGLLGRFDLGRGAPPRMETLERMEGPVTALAVSREGLVAAGGGFATTTLHDLRLTHPLRRPLPPHLSGAQVLAHSADGGRVAAVFDDGKLRVYEGRRTEPMAVADLPTEPLAWRLAFSADGQVLHLRRLNRAPSLVWELRQPVRPASELPAGELHPDGKRFLADPVRADEPMALWPLVGPRGEAQGLGAAVGRKLMRNSFSADGALLAMNAEDGVQVRALPPRPARVWTLPPPLGPQPLAAHFTAQGQLVTQAMEGTALWSLPPEEPPRTVRRWRSAAGWRATSPAVAITMDPRQRWLAMAEANGRVHVWQAAAVEAIGPSLPSGLERLSQLSFDAAGQHLFVSGQGGPVEVIGLDPRRWAGLACEQVRRNPDCAEWERFRPGQPYRALCPKLSVPRCSG
ncbi:MAG: TIR domain-containing protein [Rubrivivax sp.]|nr:TIR domain-containing protein [Rubrivivax sp.]